MANSADKLDVVGGDRSLAVVAAAMHGLPFCVRSGGDAQPFVLDVGSTGSMRRACSAHPLRLAMRPAALRMRISSAIRAPSERTVERNRFERDAAEQAVAGLTGVRNIIDDIDIFSDVEAADVSDLVQGALDRYGLIADDSEVHVDASDGTVTLTGHIRNWAEHDAVLDAAWRGVGVKNVRDDLVGPADPSGGRPRLALICWGGRPPFLFGTQHGE